MATVDKREFADCGECGRGKLVEGTGEYLWYICDCCGKEMNPNKPHNERSIEVTVFGDRRGLDDDRGADDVHYCSWRCLAKHLPTVPVEGDRFMSLPNVGLEKDDADPPGQTAEDFFALLAAGLKATETDA